MTLYIYIDIYIDIYIYIVYMMYMLYAAYMFTIYADRRCPPQALSLNLTGVSQDPEPRASYVQRTAARTRKVPFRT